MTVNSPQCQPGSAASTRRNVAPRSSGYGRAVRTTGGGPLPLDLAGRLLAIVGDSDDLLAVYRQRCDTELRGMDL